MSKITTGTYSQSGFVITVTAIGTWTSSQQVNLTCSTGGGTPFISTTISTGGSGTFNILDTTSRTVTAGSLCSVESFSIEPTVDVQSLSPSAIIDMYELDTTALGGDKTYFHPGTNILNTNVTWQGIEYSRYPIEVDGFERSGSGTLPRPKIKVANITGIISALNKVYSDLIGATLTRRRTFVKYLDAINFATGNPSADPNVGFADEVWSVDRKSAENIMYVEYELASAFDVSGVKLPRRQCIQNVCTWRYKGEGCNYTGVIYADHNDVITDLAHDKCGKRLSSCKLRFGEFSELPFGGFPGTGLIR